MTTTGLNLACPRCLSAGTMINFDTILPIFVNATVSRDNKIIFSEFQFSIFRFDLKMSTAADEEKEASAGLKLPRYKYGIIMTCDFPDENK